MTNKPKSELPLFERLLLETHAACNRTCWFCPRTHDRSGKYSPAETAAESRMMPTERILGLLHQARRMGFQQAVGFHHYSEPLLDDRNLFLARQARESGLKPRLVTNGDLLRSEDPLAEAVSETYDSVVVGLYDCVSEQDLGAEKAYWHARLSLRPIQFSIIPPLTAPNGLRSMAVARALVPQHIRFSLPNVAYPNAPCHRPLVRMIIQHDGTMCNCCEDTVGAFELGNVHERSLEQLWYSERHRRIIRDLVEGRRQRYPLCRNCPQPPTARPPGGARLEILPRDKRTPSWPHFKSNCPHRQEA